MASPKLKAEQKHKVIEMLAGRYTFQQIAEEVGITPEGVYYYSKTFNDLIKTRREEIDAQYADTGLRARQVRLNKLERLANRIETELENSLYYTEIKVSASGETAEYPVFNAPMVTQYRGLIKDISEQMGDLKPQTEININLTKAYIGFSPDEWDNSTAIEAEKD